GRLPFLYPLIHEGPHVSNGDRRGIVAPSGSGEDQTADQRQGEESSVMAHGRLLAPRASHDFSAMAWIFSSNSALKFALSSGMGLPFLASWEMGASVRLDWAEARAIGYKST